MKKARAMEKIFSLTGKGGDFYEDPFRGKPLKDFLDLSNKGDRLCSCRGAKTGEDGYDDWVWCDNDMYNCCFGYRCYHLKCISEYIRPTDPSKDKFVCSLCLAAAAGSASV